MTRYSRRISAFCIMAVFVISGLGGLIPSATGTTASDTFVYVNIGEPEYLDPAVDYESNGMSVIENVYETLVWYDGGLADAFVPVLTTEVPTRENGLISADGLTYTFHIRPGVTFHDGTALTAEDVVYSIQRVLKIHEYYGPGWMLDQVLTDYVQFYVGGPVSHYLADSYHPPWIMSILDPLGSNHIMTEADAGAVMESSVVLVDNMTVMFRLTHPYAGFVSEFATTVSSIVSKDFVEMNGGVQYGMVNDFMTWNMCGSGPYKFVSWDVGSQIHLARNDAYWGTAPSLNDVYIINGNDVYSRITMLKAGDADAAYIPIQYEDEFLNDENFEVWKGMPTFAMDFIGFNLHINTTQAAAFGSDVPMDFFQDKNVRKAFVHLMDVQSYIENCEKGNAIPPTGPIPRGMFGYDPSVPAYQYDTAMATEYLQTAINPATGNSWWVDGFAIALVYNAGNLARQTASAYLKSALESLNSMPGPHGVFSATVNALDWPTYINVTLSRSSPLPMFFMGWSPDCSDPDNYVTPIIQSEGVNPWRTGYSNPEIDALIASAAGEADPAIREAMYVQMTALCYEDAPYIWLSQKLSFQVMRSWVDGYYYNPMHNGLIYASLSKIATGSEVTKTPGKPSASAVSWTYDASSSGMWTLEVENKGLTSLMIEMKDLTTGEKMEKQTINFMKSKAFPTGTVSSEPVMMEAGHSYSITVTPIGKLGKSAFLTEHFAA
jgi:peptide/nickel transport system substrate-binding protein